jgi:hypothetical protein
MKTLEMHESNEVFQIFVGRTVARIDYVDDFGEGISVVFADGSVLNVSEAMQAGMLSVSGFINEQESNHD